MRSIRRLAPLAAAIAFAGLAPATPAAAQALAATLQWKATFSAKGYDAWGNASVVSPDGRTVFVAGATQNAADLGTGTVTAYNTADGALVWRASLAPANDDSGFSSIAVSPDGSTVFVTGHTGDAFSSLGLVQVIAAYSAATGAKQWQVTGRVHIGGTRSPVTVSADGATLFVTCAGVSTAAYNAATGAPLWSEPAGGDALALPIGAATLFVTGVPSGGTSAGITEAFNATTGATIWQEKLAGPAALPAAALSPDGAVLFVAGTIGRAFMTVAYSAESGTRIWAVPTAHADGGEVDGIAAAPDGSAVIVTESLASSSLTRHLRTLALNAFTGAALWARDQWDPRDTTHFGITGSGLAVNSSGTTAYVAGYADNAAGDSHYVAIGYSITAGARVWTARYAGRRNNFCYAIAVSPNGSQVFLTGASTWPQPRQLDAMATVAYPAT